MCIVIVRLYNMIYSYINKYIVYIYIYIYIAYLRGIREAAVGGHASRLGVVLAAEPEGNLRAPASD